jgi:hypothetical protein
MSFVRGQLIAELKYYEAVKHDLETEDLFRKIMGWKSLHKNEIKEIEGRMERLCWCCQDIM